MKYLPSALIARKKKPFTSAIKFKILSVILIHITKPVKISGLLSGSVTAELFKNAIAGSLSCVNPKKNFFFVH